MKKITKNKRKLHKCEFDEEAIRKSKNLEFFFMDLTVISRFPLN